MLIPKKNRKAIAEYLFKEGVLVAKKDFQAAHPDVEGVSNLHVIKLMQSFHSKGWVKQQYNWQYFYWALTNEGIQALREVLHAPPEVVPQTLKGPPPSTRPEGGMGGGRGGYGGRGMGRGGGGGGARDDYRKSGPAPAGFQPGFGGPASRGFGRGTSAE
eukprot:NODE_2186_length_629_cov_113.976096_g2136_i0.p1 GENE.NODE_2186_length_629_cov_113.976096_g2136_i0~~NODE_2186_length_629_cov_113.976096_g2136_i0.p1  ORF type:complete len:159 (-),score=35.73 NODE_2186_length_629_cov_113.976096_g2136_i0:81-557(-)